MDVVTAGGYEQMTIRNLAARLGVAPMSLYRHVRDKSDLLDEVVDRLLSHSWQPRASSDNWRAWVEEAADKLRAFLVAQPAALHVFLSHPVVSPAAVERMEAFMAVLRSAGFDEAGARRAYAAVHTYTIGFAALEASRSGWGPPEGRVSSLAKQLAAYTTPRQFAEGLSHLIDGTANAASTAKRANPARTAAPVRTSAPRPSRPSRPSSPPRAPSRAGTASPAKAAGPAGTAAPAGPAKTAGTARRPGTANTAGVAQAGSVIKSSRRGQKQPSR